MKKPHKWAFERRVKVARILEELIDDIRGEYGPEMCSRERQALVRTENAVWKQIDKLMPEWS